MPQNKVRDSYGYRHREHRNLEQRRRRWYAVMAVPRDLQLQLGSTGKRKTRFVASLETDSLQKAKERLPAYLTRWRAEIATVRNSSPEDADAAFYRRALAGAKTDKDRERIKEDVMLAAWDLGSRTVDRIGDAPPSSPEAQAFYAAATATAANKLADHIDGWATASQVKAKTLDLNRKAVERFAKLHPAIGDCTAANAQRYLDSMTVSPATVRRELSALRSLWKYLQRPDVAAAPKNLFPFDRLDLPKKAQKRQVRYLPFPPDAIPALLRATEGDEQLQDLIRLAAYTGARIEELAALKLKDVAEDHFNIVDAKSEAGIRAVPIHASLKQAVARLVERSADDYLLSGLTENKYKDRSNAIGKRFGRLKAKLGWRERHVFHSIRKTVITMLENAGIGEAIVADIVGHDRPTMTFGLYSGGPTMAVKAKALAKVRYP